MAAIANLAVSLTMNSQGFSRGARNARKEIGGLSGTVKSLNDQFGARSGFGRFGQMLAGGGAILGVTIIAREMEKMGRAMQDVADGMHDASLNAGEMVEKLTRGIPVFGQIFGGVHETRKGLQDLGHEATKSGWLSRLADRIGAFVSGVDPANAERMGMGGGAAAPSEPFVLSASPETEKRRLEQQAKLHDAIIQDRIKLEKAARLATLTGIDREIEAIEQRYGAELKKIDEVRAKAKEPANAAIAGALAREIELMERSAEQIRASQVRDALNGQKRKASDFGGLQGATRGGETPELGVALRGTFAALEAERRGTSNRDVLAKIQRDQLAHMRAIAETLKRIEGKGRAPVAAASDGGVDARL